MDHDNESQAEKQLSQVEKFTQGLRDLIRRHSEGEPVYAEMAARIEARARDPHGLLE